MHAQPLALTRPCVPSEVWSTALTFQLLDCLQHKTSPVAGVSLLSHNEVPELRLFGVTRAGQSVLIRVYNFAPYCWVEAPENWADALAPQYQAALNTVLAGMTRVESCVVRIETHMRQNLMHYRGGQPKPFLKIVTQLPQHVPRIKALMSERGVAFPVLWDGVQRFNTFESNVIFPLRFLVDVGIGGANWITMGAGQFSRVVSPVSTAQIEAQADWRALTPHDAVGEYMTIAPLRIMSMDIECKGRKGFFPEAEKDPVIQIANHVISYGEPGHLSKTIFTLGSCAAIAGADVHSFEDERDMLVAWVDYLQAVDPDVLTGYNITGFDFPYLLNRATTLKITPQFARWSRLLGDRTEAKTRQFQSKQMGNREYTDVNIDGRVTLDLLTVMQRDFKLRSYSLNSVSQHFLGEQKEDVHHSIIADLQDGNSETRRRLAVYCLKDALLPIRLLQKLLVMVNNVEMARVTGVPVAWLLERGQGIKVFSQMLRKSQKRGLLFPVHEYQGGNPDTKGYEGATVIPPERGFYKDPVATLDFASLYPSIMMAHNLCYSTLVPKHEVSRYPEDDLTTTPSGDTFVKTTRFSGILPEILVELLSARKKAKKLMAEATDELEKAVLNGRQLALKVSANSVYGFTGAQVGKLPCLQISASVTSFGRQMIMQTKQFVEKNYENVEVIYGDTDSVMIRYTGTSEDMPDKQRIEETMAFGMKAAGEVTKEFIQPIKLEFEKVYFPYLLMNKKRYAGLLWSNSDKYDKLDAKGIETVRRDNSPLVANIISGVLNRLLIHRSTDAAIDYVKGTVRDLLMNRLDISQLVISKAFSKAEDEYENKQAHIALVERMRQRDPASAPTIGDRVAYVIVKAGKGARAFERSEDPIYVLENNVPIDTQYYLDRQLGPALLRVFEAVMPNPQTLIRGDHTRQVAQAIPSATAVGSALMKFVKVQRQCLACKSAIKDGAMCRGCDHKAMDVYASSVAKRNHLEAMFSRVWTQCQQCQGSLHQDVLCSSRDCPVFYMRTKIQKDLKEQQNIVDRFGLVADW